MNSNRVTQDEQLTAAKKTISILMDRVEHAIDTAGSLHNLFEDNLILKQKLSEHLKSEEQLREFNRTLEEQVAARTQELKEANKALNKRNRRLKEMVRKDGLTGLYNHSGMSKLFLQKVNEAKRYKHPLSVVMFDIDYFKSVNDTYGHPFGDHVLRVIAEVIVSSVRTVDYASRFGGEEFLLLMPNITGTGAKITAERIRQKISELRWKHDDLTTTISGGVATFQNETMETLIARADRCLYRAKDAGRNRIVM